MRIEKPVSTPVCMHDGKKYTLAKTLKDIEAPWFVHFLSHSSALACDMQHVQRCVRDDGGYVISRDKSEDPDCKAKKGGVYRITGAF